VTCLLDGSLTISNPHRSHHEPRNINVIAKVECPLQVPEITLVVSLYRDGKRVNSTTRTAFAKTWLKANSASGCKGTAGNYRGTVTARVIYPPGAVPPSTTRHLASPIITVNCW